MSSGLFSGEKRKAFLFCFISDLPYSMCLYIHIQGCLGGSLFALRCCRFQGRRPARRRVRAGQRGSARTLRTVPAGRGGDTCRTARGTAGPPRARRTALLRGAKETRSAHFPAEKDSASLGCSGRIAQDSPCSHNGTTDYW